MAIQVKKEVHIEIAHVLVMDIVVGQKSRRKLPHKRPA